MHQHVNNALSLFFPLRFSTKSLPYIVVKFDPMSKMIFTLPNFQQIDARNQFDITGQKFGIPYGAAAYRCLFTKVAPLPLPLVSAKQRTLPLF